MKAQLALDRSLGSLLEKNNLQLDNAIEKFMTQASQTSQILFQAGRLPAKRYGPCATATATL
jgi:hypothetical protein